MANSNFTFRNSYFLVLMSFGYVIGEIAHFLIITTSRQVARDVQYGDKGCYDNVTFPAENKDTNLKCESFKNESTCGKTSSQCEWNYNGRGYEAQILAGPAWVAVFTITGLLIGFASDRIRESSFGRHRLMAFGFFVFSICLLLMGCSQQYWQLVLLRMGIAVGEAACRPTSGSLIAELFPPTARGVANGIFNWGIYYGYGLAYILGGPVTELDILGYGWRSAYVISAIPGIVMAVLIATTVSDPAKDDRYKIPVSTVADDERNNSKSYGSSDDIADQTNSSVQALDEDDTKKGFREYGKRICKEFFSPAMLLLLIAATFRQCAGFSWAYNTKPYFLKYYPGFDISYWILACSIGGGSFGVFFGGFLSDRVVTKLGLHSRLWVLAVSQLLAAPFSVLVLYLEPPYALYALIGYYLCAETWFAILFTVIVEIVSLEIRSIAIAFFIFLMNNVAGNFPVLVTTVRKSLDEDYRTALYIFWPGFIAISGILFFVASLPLMKKHKDAKRTR